MNKGLFDYVPTLAIGLAAVCLFLIAISGPGYRIGLLDVHMAITCVKWSALLAIPTAVISLVGAVIAFRLPLPRSRFALCLLAFVFSLGLFGNGMRMKQKAERLPPIHDVTTNPKDLPVYHSIAPLRASAPNALEYDGEIEALQTHFYPELQPLDLKAQPKDTFEKALRIAKSFGWEIVASDPENNEVEAVDTSFWFGFKDDVIVRVRPFEGGSRLDLRSTSRVGVSDLGVNAARIAEFLKRFKND